MTTEKNWNTAKALISTILGFLFLSSVGVLVKLEEKAGASIEWIIFVQFTTCLIIVTALASRNRFADLKTLKVKYHIIRGVTGVLAFTCYAIAVTKIPLVNAALLNNTTPVFIPIITFLWLKVKIDKKIWWGITIGFIGIIFILHPNESMLLQGGDIFGLAAGILLAISYVSLKVLAKTESFTAVLFYYSFIAFCLSLPFAILKWSNPEPLIWFSAIMTGILFVSYMFLLQYGYKNVEAVKLAPFNYSTIVFTGIFDWLIFNHVPGISAITGIILVTVGGILAITLHEKVSDTKTKHHWHF